MWRQFHHLPYAVYRDDTNWVPPLLLERRMHFDPKHNPFYQHAKVQVFLAYRGGEPVGRITAQIDTLHLEQHDDATGHFGFIEAIDDPAVFEALLAAAEGWLKQQGMTRSVGPVSFAMWDEPGLLVDGFDCPPNVLMGHHRPYYQQRIVEAGYRQVQDLLAYDYPIHTPLPEAMQRMVERAGQKLNFNLRPIRLDGEGIKADMAIVRDILNDAWSENWGFVPITEAEIADIASLFKLVLKPDALVIAEDKGEAVGVAMMLPNINELTADLGGRLFPFGFLKLIWRLKTRPMRSGRMALMGVRKRYWTAPAGAILAVQMIERAKTSDYAKNAVRGELSWILDSNERIKRMMEMLNATVIKRYRIYEKTI